MIPYTYWETTMRQAQAGMIHLTLTTAKNVGIVTTS